MSDIIVTAKAAGQPVEFMKKIQIAHQVFRELLDLKSRQIGIII
jgi:hypothetical protein